MRCKNGFTIIELIVVIAIIAVLATIVLANIDSYILKGNDAAAMRNLGTLMDNAIMFRSGTLTGYLGRSNYYISTSGNFSSTLDCINGYSDIFGRPCDALTKMGYTLTIAYGDPSNSDRQKWCASVVMKADTTQSYCVDSNGTKKKGAGETCASGVCP